MSPDHGLSWILRSAVLLLVGVLLAIGLATAVANWHLTDLKAYLAAAELLASGGNPYDVALVERGLPYHYHYAPWFAALFVPLAALPADVVRIGWSVILALASAAALWPIVRGQGVAGLALGGLMAFLLLNLVAEGNVQPLLLAGMVWSLERRAGPIMIGVAASLKIVPILLALVYVGRGEWHRAAIVAVTAGVLMAPTLLFELPPQSLDTGGTGLFTSAPIAWAISVAAGVVAIALLARTPFAWLAATTATVLSLPRLLVFDVTNLVASLPVKPRTAGPTD